MLDIVIAGAGGCGREVYEMALETFSPDEYRIKGFLSDIPTDLDRYPEIKAEAEIIGAIADYEVQKNDRFLLAIGDVDGRKKVASLLKQRGAEFLSLIHPSAVCSRYAVWGEGLILYRLSGLSTCARVGDFCLINSGASVGHDVIVGDYSVLCPYAAIGGGTVIGDECFISTHATIAPKLTVGKNSCISANAFVARKVPENSFVTGVPAKNYQR